jgi:glycosyltransferase involved in cell wall biosynthesis
MRETVAIIAPCFNENQTVIQFLSQLEETLSYIPYHFTVVIVDDCSTDNTLALLRRFSFSAYNLDLKVITLPFNVGHQQAIYQGLLYGRELSANKIVIMDSDGEDDPRAILDILTIENADIVHVVRGKRSEGLFFKLSYAAYKMLFRLVTNQNMNFGNYCLINQKILNASVHTSFIHFAAYLSRMKAKHAYITYDRKKRIGGKSKMSTASLISHAFHSLTEYADRLLMVFLKLFVLLAIAFSGSIGYILYQRLFTDNAISGWASTMSVGLITTALVAIGFYVIGVLLLNLTYNCNSSLKKRLYQPLDSLPELTERI